MVWQLAILLLIQPRDMFTFGGSQLQARAEIGRLLPKKAQIELSTYTETHVHGNGNFEEIKLSDTYHCTIQQLLAAVSRLGPCEKCECTRMCSFDLHIK